ncbi:inheritance of peroxisomes protein 1-domain-containing protein [Fusarium avenaceum]|nr:inheritance of peroxisomes protein 1-domain-containing protein [Fusarium avenaceum]
MDGFAEDLPPHRAPRRVSTTPLPARESTDTDTPDSDLVETLYSHPNVKIISFTATGRAFARSPGGPALSNVDPPNSLSWSSQLERTIAVGPFRIYRAPRSVAFLSCGSALQPILRKSQCWCIDEVNSRFVLQIRRPNYWRIELPIDDPEDQQRAEDLREVLDKILQFEKTECPFKRTFTVDLPEQVPVTILPWTPRSQPIMPSDDVASVSSTGSRRSSFVGRTSTPTPLNNSRQHAEIPTSPMSSRPASAASCVVPTTISLYEEYGMSIDPLQPKGTGTSGHTESSTKPLEVVPERPTDGDFLDPFHSSFPESYSSPSFSTDLGLHTSHGGSSILSSSPTQDDASMYELHEGSGNRGGRMKARLRRRTGGFTTTRSATMPPHLMPTFDRSKPTSSTSRDPLLRSVSETTRKPILHNVEASRSTENKSKSEPRALQPSHPHGSAQQSRLLRRDSEESFHSVESWHSSGAPLHLSPPTSHAESFVESRRESNETDTLSVEGSKMNKSSQSRGTSPMPCAWESDSEDDSGTSSKSEALDAIPTGELTTQASIETKETTPAASVPQRPFVPRHRATTSSISVRRRALSPLPPAANLFTPASTMERRPYRSRLETVRNLPMAIIAKTCEMIMGPPSSLIRLILKVAAKIASGQWRGLVYGYSEDGEEIPVQWDYSEEEFSDWSGDEDYQHDHRSSHKHHGKREHRHNRHRSNHGKASQGSGAENELRRQPSSSDDSRSWGVD